MTMRISLRHRLVATAACLAATAALAACGNGSGTDTVTLFGIWTGGERAEFEQVLAQFEAETGIGVVYTGARDAANVLESDVRTGDPPDLAVLQTPYELTDYAGDQLVPLDDVLDREVIEHGYPRQWRDLMRGGTGAYQAVIVKATLKSLVWYEPATFAGQGYEPPATWTQLQDLSERIRADGRAPWCLGLESTPSSGWPGTDWIEDILLHRSGPETYQAWASGQLAWTSSEVAEAWRAWGSLVTGTGAVHGGAHAALVTNFSEAGRPLFDNPPGCYLHHAASFIRGMYEAYSEPGQAGFFPFPEIAPEHANTHVVAADLMVMFQDTPAARELVNFIATARAQQIWPTQGTGALSVNDDVPAEVYADETSRRTAAILTDPDARVYFDASDQMPADLREAFNQAVLRYLAAPDELDSILGDLERVRLQAS